MSKSKSTRSRLLRAGLTTGVAVAAVLGASTSPAFAATALVLSSTSGPSGGLNTITAQAPTTGVAPFLASTAPVVQFQAITATVTACTALYKTPVAVAGTGTTLTAGVVDTTAPVTRINAYRIAVKIPAGLALPGTFTLAKFNMCVYDTNSTTASTLLANAAYSVAVKPTITNITPTSGPALGGYQVNVSGTGFTVGSTATLGNVPLTNIVVNASGTLLSGTAPPRTAGTGIQMVVTTVGGTVSSNDPNGDGTLTDATNFTLSNGIVVTPNTAVSGTTPDLDIMGVGFSAMTLTDSTVATVLSTTSAHIVLVSKSSGYAPAAAGTGRPVALCMNVLVLSDTELLCNLDLNNSLDPTIGDIAGSATDVPTGAYSLQIIQNGALAATAPQIDATAITSGSTFTVAPY